MTFQRCFCGKHKNHNGDKKLSNAHSKILQKQFAEEQVRLENLNGKTVKVIFPFWTDTSKTGARIV